MIRVNFLTLETGEICGFEVCGHANYGEHGKDIVCAAVSSAAYMVVNTISDVLNVSAEVNVRDDGYMYLRVPDKSVYLCEILLKGLKNHLILMEESYPRNLKVNYEEVK